MKNYTIEILGNKMIFFTKIIFTFIAISFLIFINFLDLQESRRNNDYLNLITSVYNKGEQAFEFQNYELERIEYLQNNDKTLSELHVNSRNNLIDALQYYGIFLDRKSKGQGDNKNRVVLMIKNLKIKRSNLHIRNNRFTIPEEFSPFDRKQGTVDSAIRFFNRYAHPEKAYILTSFDKALLKQKLDSAINAKNLQRLQLDSSNSNSNRPTGNGTNSTLLSLNNGNIYITPKCLIINFNDGTGPGQGAFINDIIKITAHTDSVVFPSTLQFAGFDSTLVTDLLRNKIKQDELKGLYGYYDIQLADKLIQEAFSRNTTAVSILGFDVSRKWFPISLFLILTVVYAALHNVINTAKMHDCRIISEHNFEDPLSFVVEQRIVRLLVWVVSPVLLLFFILYSNLIHYNIIIYIFLVISTVICLGFGWISYRKSLTL